MVNKYRIVIEPLDPPRKPHWWNKNPDQFAWWVEMWYDSYWTDFNAVRHNWKGHGYSKTEQEAHDIGCKLIKEQHEREEAKQAHRASIKYIECED